MKKRNFCPMAAAVLTAAVILQPFSTSAGALGQIRSIAKSIISGEPKEVEELRQMEVAQSEEGHQEYYFKQLTEEEQRVYRELLKGIRAREKEFYLTISDDDSIDRSYHAVLKDHPEIFWVHNREKIYKTTYSDSDYCVFTPGYTYTDSEIDEIQTAMEQSFQEVRALIPEDAGDYEKVRIVYTYVIDHTQYQTGEDDQSIAGVFWKKSAVCAGYAGAVQYLLERLDIPCIYVDGSTKGSTEGHAWDIVKIGQEYYYVDATNGDQPDFLNACLKMRTLLYPEELLKELNRIEKEAGRERIIHWGPRTLDLDILLYDDIVLEEDDLCIPHVEMHKRSFVLEPLAEIAPYKRHPVYGKTVREMLEEIQAQL